MTQDDLQQQLAAQAKELWSLTKVVKRLTVAYETLSLASLGRIDDALSLMQANKRWLHDLDYQKLADAIGPDALFEHELEWNQHGITRTFRFWSPDEVARYLTTCNRLVDDLRSLTPNVCFGFGAVLGHVREKNLIAHDDDVDIIIAVPGVTGFPEGVRVVSELLQKKGYSVKRLKTHLHVSDGGEIIDVFIGLESGPYGNWRPGPIDTIELASIFPASIESFCGVECPFPRETVRYLEQVYGPSWSVPQKNWRHDWKASRAMLLTR